jgi:preprotein translocase subunit YajC
VEFLILIVFGFGLMWLLVLLPQRRRQAAHDSMLRELKPGDYVLTAGGVYGTVTELGEDDLGLEIAPDVEVRVSKRAIGALIPPDEILEEELSDERQVGARAGAGEPSPESSAQPGERRPG